MREEVKVVKLDRPQQGVTLTALVDFRNRRLQDGGCPRLADEIIKSIFDAPTKKERVKPERAAR